MKHSWKIFVAIILVFTQVNFTDAQVVTGTPGFSANAFQVSVCINGHMEYQGGTPYGNVPYILAILQVTNISCMRDSANQMAVIVPALNVLGAAGIKSTLTVSAGNNAQYIVNQIRQLNSSYIGCLEGPNELNVSGDANWAADDVNEQGAINQAVQILNSSSICRIGPSTSNGAANNSYAPLGNLSFQEDYIPMHNYLNACNPETTGGSCSQSGVGNYGGYVFPSIFSAIANAQQAAASKPVISTENGYCTLVPNPICVDYPRQVDYLLRLLAQQFKDGVPITYLYDIADENESFSGTTYGLVTQNGGQKPALTALAGFRAILADASASSSPCFVPAYTTNGNTATLGLCFSDGSYGLVYWNPASEWNAATSTPITVSPFNVRIFLSTGFTPSTTISYSLNNATGVYTSTVSPDITNIPITTSPGILRFNGPASPVPMPSIPTPLPT